jgi:hypothetical protein
MKQGVHAPIVTTREAPRGICKRKAPTVRVHSDGPHMDPFKADRSYSKQTTIIDYLCSRKVSTSCRWPDVMLRLSSA